MGRVLSAVSMRDKMGRKDFQHCRLEETETLLAAQRDVNRGLDNDVHKLMAQLEDLNR